jgi:hypothetical protein
MFKTPQEMIKTEASLNILEVVIKTFFSLSDATNEQV